MPRALLVAACAVAVPVLSAPGSAGACEPLACTTAHFVPGDGEAWPVGTFPSYRPAGSLNEPPDLSTLELIDPSGNPAVFGWASDPVFPRFFTLRPVQDVVGTYRVRFPTGDCAPGPVREVSFERTAEEVEAVPVGSVFAGPPRREPRTVASASGLCVETIDAGVVRLEVAISPELEPLLGLASFELVVDGETWARTLYGDALDRPASEYPGSRVVSELFTACDQDRDFVDAGLAPGPHLAELRMTVVHGAHPHPAFPPARFEFSIECPEEGAGGAGGGGGAGGTGGTDVEPPGPAGAGADAAGCACGTPGSASPGFLLLGLAWLARRRRR